MRFYSVDGKRLPSVTTILGRTAHIFDPSKEAGLSWWRGKEPDHIKIVEDACRRGSIIHSEIELALTGKQSAEYTIQEWSDHNVPDYMTHLLPIVQELGKNEVEVEKVVAHPAGYAGTADLIGWYEGRKVICDWKSTRPSRDVGERLKKRSHYVSAEIQLAAYAAAFNSDERREPITHGMIAVAYDWREPQLFQLDTDDLRARAAQFQERLEVFQILEAE